MLKSVMLKRLVVFSFLLMFCSYTKWEGYTIDRLAAGQLFKARKDFTYLSRVYPLTSPLTKDIYENCGWGFYLAVDQYYNNFTPLGGFVLRF